MHIVFAASEGLPFSKTGGLADVVDAFADWADRRMLAKLNKTNPAQMRVRDRVRPRPGLHVDLKGRGDDLQLTAQRIATDTE